MTDADANGGSGLPLDPDNQMRVYRCFLSDGTTIVLERPRCFGNRPLQEYDRSQKLRKAKESGFEVV